ncbi:hypothetical protein BJ878DRAFT_572487, partial [Calycina marina]
MYGIVPPERKTIHVHVDGWRHRHVVLGPDCCITGDDAGVCGFGGNGIHVSHRKYYWVSEYSPPRVQKLLRYIVGTLLTIALISFVIVSNTVLSTRLLLIEGTVLILHLVVIFYIIIPLWMLAPRASLHVLTGFTDYVGWSSRGLSD